MSRIAKSLNISRKFKGPLSIGSLSKANFERGLQAQLNLTEKYSQALCDCEELVEELETSPTLIGRGLKLMKDSIGG